MKDFLQAIRGYPRALTEAVRDLDGVDIIWIFAGWLIWVGLLVTALLVGGGDG